MTEVPFGVADPVNIPGPNLELLRDRCLQFATGVSATTEELLNNADIIMSYILSGVNPFVPEDPGPSPDSKSFGG